MDGAINRAILRVILPYVALAGLWILLSDQVLGYVSLDAATITQWSIYKGLAFVLVTAFLLATLLRKELTRRGRDRDALHQSEERLRVLGDNLPDSYVFQYTREDDGTPRFVYLSTGAERLHGIRVEDALRDASLLLGQVDPKLTPALREAEAVSLRNLSDFMIELRLRRSDGHWRWLQMCARPRRTSDGCVLWDGTVSDITERKLTEHEREATLEFLKLAQESSGTADLIHRSIAFFQRQSGCDKVDVRLRDGEDYPCYESCGGQPEFVYESVALLPLRTGGERLVGLLQLNSRGKGAFSPQAIELWERLSGYLAIALSHTHTQEALLEGEARIRTLGDNIPGGALYQLLAPPGGRSRYTHMSAGVEKIFGVSAERVVADPEAFWQLIVDEDRPRIDAEQERSAREMNVFDCEFRQRTNSGEIKWFHARSTPRKLEDGSLVWDGVVADINARKRTEEALRDSEMRFRSLIESAPDAIYVQSEGRFAYLNPSMLALLGSSRTEELLDTQVFARIAPEYHDSVCARIQSQHETGRRATLMDQEYLRLDGARVPVETTAVPIRFLNRNAHLVFVRDITERKRAEAERERLMAAIEQSSEIVVITDTAGTIQYVNPAFERVSGYTRAEALGQNPHVLKSGKHDAPFYAALWQTITDGDTWTGRFINKRKDGSLYTEEASISPVRNAAGRTVNYVAVKRDITEQLRLETELRQAQKMESVGRLAGGVAHDFNNMLSVILGSVELALSAAAPGQPLCADLEEIRKAAERSADLTQQLLTFARKQAVAPRVLDLNDAVSSTLKMLRRLIGENVELAWRPCSLDTTVRIDPSQLDQILANLTVNARDAIAGVGQLVIETGNAALAPHDCAGHEDAHPGDYVTLAVSDTGCGMDAATLEHVFEPFFTTKDVGEGTGLGLATVYGIVQQNGGFITVRSELGNGTSFTVFLPRLPREAASPRKPEAAPCANVDHETILLVEDEPALLKLGKRTLERLGYHVVTAGTPGEAIIWAEQNVGKTDLLITDVIMPEMTGWDLAKHLLTLDPNLRLLFMSGYASDSVAQHDLLSNGALFLPKPFTLKALSAKVAEALSAH